MNVQRIGVDDEDQSSLKTDGEVFFAGRFIHEGFGSTTEKRLIRLPWF